MTNRQDSNPQKEPLRDLSPSPLSRLASAITALRHNQDLLRNAGSLIATTGITSVLGFAYWIYAARVFSTGAVGYASAAISTMILLGTIGMFGLDTLLIGELPRGGNRGGLTMASCIAAFLVSFVLGVGFCLVSLAFGTHFVEVNGTIGRMAVFSFGVAITGATTVFDSATIGLMRGGIQLYRNAALSVAKMVALPVVAFVLNDRFGVGIMLSWVLGTVISLIPVAITIWRGGGRILHRPDWNSLWRLRKLAMAHNWLNLAMNIPLKLIPVLVALVVVPSANGAYYIATLVASFLTMVPYSLSQVLFAVASAAPERIPEKLRFVLRMSLVIGLPGGLVMGLSAHLHPVRLRLQLCCTGHGSALDSDHRIHPRNSKYRIYRRCPCPRAVQPGGDIPDRFRGSADGGSRSGRQSGRSLRVVIRDARRHPSAGPDHNPGGAAARLRQHTGPFGDWPCHRRSAAGAVRAARPGCSTPAGSRPCSVGIPGESRCR